MQAHAGRHPCASKRVLLLLLLPPHLVHTHCLHSPCLAHTCTQVRYHSDTQALKIAQGVSGTVRDKGSVRRNVPFLVQAVRQGFQVRAVPHAPPAHARTTRFCSRKDGDRPLAPHHVRV